MTPEDKKYIAAIEKMLDTAIPVHELGASKSEEPEAETKEDLVHADSETDDKESKSRRRGRNRKKKSDDVETTTETTKEETSETEQPERVAEEKPRRSRGGRNRRRDRDDDDEKVIGMGDHVPAFMLREVKLPRRSKTSEEEETEKETEEA